jgi:RhtB (resistance to homoserine/threonine) family protein
MDFFLKWLLFASVNAAATISPGPAFAMTVRNAVLYDRRTALLTVLGLGLGVGAHMLLVLCGIAVVLSQSILLFNIVKYIGAAYLVFIGFQALKSKKRTPEQGQDSDKERPPKGISLSVFHAVRIGFLTNVLNPKAVVFFTAIITQFVDPHAGAGILLLYGLTSISIEIIWFSMLTLFLTHPKVKARFMAIAHWIERLCGGLLIALGVRLALSKIE